MKTFIKILLFLVCGISFCKAQDSTVMLSSGMFDKSASGQYINLNHGWLFKQGNDTAWAKKDIDISNWKKLNPENLSAKYAGKNGRLECWFRLKIKLDTAFGKQQLGLVYSSWAAADLYINGRQVSSFGNTGQNGYPFAEYNALGDHVQTPVDLKPGNEYVIALHFVDHLSPFLPRHLKSEDFEIHSLLGLTGPQYGPHLLNAIKKATTYSTVWVSVCTILCLMFWLLSIQSPGEKDLRPIAVQLTFFALTMICVETMSFADMPYMSSTLLDYVFNSFTALIFIITPFTLASIFKRKVSRGLKIFLLTIFLYAIGSNFLPDIGKIVLAAAIVIVITICIYYIISSWRNLKGAQWSVVVGLLASLSVLLLLFIIIVLYPNTEVKEFIFYLITVFVLAFPLSILVYVAIRFREIIAEVRQNALQVLKLSEEKREQALSRQKTLEEEVNRQTAEIRTTLDNLRSAQTQLIQSEKMASLGELTAGIAHEIQNPLNFVNNFSEVNTEMLDELEDELKNGNTVEALSLVVELKQNEEKINHHGKRADAIVKGMLQHSRTSSAQKELIDINALAEEYLRLSYHGLRAKDKGFNAEMTSHLAPGLRKINVVPQDIGRVLLNLFNNAFYAVNQKKKTAGADYKPEVSVTTLSENEHIIIKVKDNGTGIPDAIKEKIMQPFFTTKPTGEGTGLGLSLSYDMVVKGHGGSMTANSREGESSEFIIQLPVTK